MSRSLTQTVSQKFNTLHETEATELQRYSEVTIFRNLLTSVMVVRSCKGRNRAFFRSVHHKGM
jgi:hypothetical protein